MTKTNYVVVGASQHREEFVAALFETAETLGLILYVQCRRTSWLTNWRFRDFRIAHANGTKLLEFPKGTKRQAIKLLCGEVEWHFNSVAVFLASARIVRPLALAGSIAPEHNTGWKTLDEPNAIGIDFADGEPTVFAARVAAEVLSRHCQRVGISLE